MKALKNESACYVEAIRTAIDNCYTASATPTNEDLMRLYATIGSAICAQGEKAFIAYLADFLGARCPTIKGFSPRNLRRMRDFFKSYESRPNLMAQARRLSWTQNVVILDHCETQEQREFYLALAAKQSLSKLALLGAIREKAMERSVAEVVASIAPLCGLFLLISQRYSKKQIVGQSLVEKHDIICYNQCEQTVRRPP